MVSRSYAFKFFKGCLPQNLLGAILEYFVPHENTNERSWPTGAATTPENVRQRVLQQ